MNPRNRQQYRNYSTWFLHRCIFCWITTCAILLHQNTANAQQQNIDNIVKLADLFEGPDVKCGSEVITVSFFWRDRQQPINGQVYVAGKDAVPDCVTAFNFTRWSRGYELKFDIDITSSKCVPDRKRYSQLHLYRTRLLYRNSHIPDQEFQPRRNSSQYVLYRVVFGYTGFLICIPD